MIESETIQVVYSELVMKQVHSEEDPDYRSLIEVRVTENDEIRKLEDDEIRIL